MKKNDHIEFTGKLPKELKKTTKPLYGTVVKLIGKNKVEVKPKHKRFTVSVALTDLTKVKKEKFTKKRTKKSTLKVVPKNEGIVKAVAKAKYPKPEDDIKVDTSTKIGTDKPIMDLRKDIHNAGPLSLKKPVNKTSGSDYDLDDPYKEISTNNTSAIIIRVLVIVALIAFVSYCVFA